MNIKYPKWDKRGSENGENIFWMWIKEVFYGGMQEIKELGRRSCKIGKKKFLDLDKKFRKIYSKSSKGVNIKHSNWDKRSSENRENMFWKRIQEFFIVECKKFKNCDEKVLK